jgi:hypothetical protein
LKVTGQEVFRYLKYESGVHRVQRVPATETQGRVHTSTVTVAVLPEAEEVDVELKQEDLRIEVCRAGGAGGQHVNRTESAVQIFHLPTGLYVRCEDGRSQIKNKEMALQILRSKLYEQKLREQQEASPRTTSPEWWRAIFTNSPTNSRKPRWTSASPKPGSEPPMHGVRWQSAAATPLWILREARVPGLPNHPKRCGASLPTAVHRAAHAWSAVAERSGDTALDSSRR